MYVHPKKSSVAVGQLPPTLAGPGQDPVHPTGESALNLGTRPRRCSYRGGGRNAPPGSCRRLLGARPRSPTKTPKLIVRLVLDWPLPDLTHAPAHDGCSPGNPATSPPRECWLYASRASILEPFQIGPVSCGSRKMPGLCDVSSQLFLPPHW